jgi:hypothetical protein
MDVHGQSGTGYAGDFVLKASSSVKKWTPVYGGGKTTTVRFLPVRSPDNPAAWEQFMISTSNNGRTWGDWIRQYQVARMGEGDASVSFITHDPCDPVAFDTLNSPPWVLYNAVNRRVSAKSDPGWGGYLKGGDNRGAALSRPNGAYFGQVWLVNHKDGACNPPIGFLDDGVLNILQFSAAAGDGMLKQIEAPRPGYQGDPNDLSQALQYGDIVALNQGAYVTFYSKADGDPRQRQQQQSAATWQQAAANAPVDRKAIGFDSFVTPTFNGITADLSAYEAGIAAKTKPWEAILNFPTTLQQAAWLADRFPPDMIVFAFEGHPEWIPEAVHAKARNRLTVGQVGGGGWLPQQGADPYSQLQAPTGWPTAASNPYGQPPVSGPPEQQWQPAATPLAPAVPAQQWAPQPAATQPVQQWAPQPAAPQPAQQWAPQPAIASPQPAPAATQQWGQPPAPAAAIQPQYAPQHVPQPAATPQYVPQVAPQAQYAPQPVAQPQYAPPQTQPAQYPPAQPQSAPQYAPPQTAQQWAPAAAAPQPAAAGQYMPVQPGMSPLGAPPATASPESAAAALQQLRAAAGR